MPAPHGPIQTDWSNDLFYDAGKMPIFQNIFFSIGKLFEPRDFLEIVFLSGTSALFRIIGAFSVFCATVLIPEAISGAEGPGVPDQGAQLVSSAMKIPPKRGFQSTTHALGRRIRGAGSRSFLVPWYLQGASGSVASAV
ncbi:hypothetical protein AB9K34_15005 [Sedimentitalea sp. XS_ASV28]|uniref:hypothetical protein n=1 Tax=Sedimentitalea sp. XS_ASV28 TaxID=3241296 RepID=UPI003514277B